MTETREIVVRLQLEYGPPPATPVAASADQPLLYQVAAAAKLLAIGVSAVNELIAQGELESVKIGRSRRVTRAGLESYVRRLALLGIGPPDTAEADSAPTETASPADVPPATTRSTPAHDSTSRRPAPSARRRRGAA